MEIGLAITNYEDTHKCIPSADPMESQKFGWRGTLITYFQAGPVPDNNMILSAPANYFNLSGSPTYVGQATTIYAIVGNGSAFSNENRCRTSSLPKTMLLLVSGKESKSPWHSAENIPIDTLRTTAHVRDVVGEVSRGVSYVVFLNGEVSMIDSSAPCEVLARCAEALDTDESARAQQALFKYLKQE